ncbi:replication-relaxation family protein [Clostridium sp. YIM B02500]|uniref:replication-relaxation family protein n=1 Tax=Clostridium sp. YIM B02500 TaxID=2910681 RepID=UPI001EEF2E52|nr:replication-relaxation family protein [Clostridium sp. YIM B02500]
MLTNRDREILTWIEEYKAITVPQCTQLYFNGNYEGCRRRLKQLEDMSILKSTVSTLLKAKVYFREKMISNHDLLVYEFLKEVKKYGANIIAVKNQPRFLDGEIRPDAFITFSHNGNVFFVLLEIDLTHNTPIGKMQKYEELFNSGEVQKQCCGTFPIVIISRPSNARLRYNSKNFNVVYLDLFYNNINSLLLQNPTII